MAGFASLSAQELENGDFSKGVTGWKIDLPRDARAVTEISPDAADGKPALKITVGDAANLKPWKGNIQKAVALPEAGSYTITFLARSEPGDANIIIGAIGSTVDHPNIGNASTQKVTEEWQELHYNVTVDSPDPAATIIWRNLAVPGKTFYFANVRITKD